MIVIKYVKYMFKKVNFIRTLCEVVAAEHLNISQHIWYKNSEGIN